MDYTVIDMENSPRQAHYSYFVDMADPYVGLTADVDISGFAEFCKTRGFPFFLSFLYCVSQAANSVAELRQRIADRTVMEFKHCDTSHTVLRDDGTYCYCRLNTMRCFADYMREAIPVQQSAKEFGTLSDGEDAASLLFVSSLPWLHYSALRQPTPRPADSNPRITWGRYKSVNGTTVIPVTLLAHHALVDGIHIAAFYRELERAVKELIRAEA